MKALDICFSSTSFTFQQTIYQQIFGTQMNLPLSPIIANMVMEKLEERANNSFHSFPWIWFSYVDDVYGIMESNYIEEFHQYVNTICDSIKFTRKEEHEGSLAFVDVLVTYTPKEWLQTTVFRKPTHTGRYLPFSSHHSFKQKLSIPRTIFSRAENIIKEDELKKDEIYVRSTTPWLQMDIQDFIANDGLLTLKVNPTNENHDCGSLRAESHRAYWACFAASWCGGGYEACLCLV